MAPIGQGAAAMFTMEARQSERIVGLWYGRFKVKGRRGWTDCRLSDVSSGGAAMEVGLDVVLGTEPLLIEVRSLCSVSDHVRLQAFVRHDRILPDGRRRVGLEFQSGQRLEPLERMIERHANEASLTS
jgi:hypothetical protein